MSNEQPTGSERHRTRQRRAFDEAVIALAAFGGRVSSTAPKLRGARTSGDRADILRVIAQLEVFERQSAELRHVLGALEMNVDPPPMPLNEAAMAAAAAPKEPK